MDSSEVLRLLARSEDMIVLESVPSDRNIPVVVAQAVMVEERSIPKYEVGDRVAFVDKGENSRGAVTKVCEVMVFIKPDEKEKNRRSKAKMCWLLDGIKTIHDTRDD